MKILKRNFEQRNLLIFLSLSLVYLQSISSLTTGSTIFSMISLRAFFIDHYLTLLITLVAGYLVVTMKRFSEWALLICLIVIVGKTFILLSGSFNKLILVLNFIYLLFAFYFFVSWETEVGLACFNPHFSRTDLEKETRFKIRGRISSGEHSDTFWDVHLTNLDEQSCFLLLSPNHGFDYSSREYFLEAVYEGVHFKHKALLVTKYDRGIGLLFIKTPDTRVNWSELYKVCLERGFVG